MDAAPASRNVAPAGATAGDGSAEEVHDYRLYVSATSPISSRAIVNARRFLDDCLPGRYRLAILNIADNVEDARADQVVASPTLIRLAPLPRRRFIGDMSDPRRLRASLGLDPAPEA